MSGEPKLPRFRIAMDIDSVLADTIVVMSAILKDKFGITHTKEMDYQWDTEKCLLHMFGIKLTGQQYLSLFDDVWAQWKDIPMTEPYVAHIMDIAHHGHQMDFVTYAKTDEQFENKIKWLERYIYNIWNPSGNTLTRIINSRGCAGWKYEMDYDVFVEDCPHIVVGAVVNGKYGILYDQPWNRGVSKPYMTARIYTLEELYLVLAGLK